MKPSSETMFNVEHIINSIYWLVKHPSSTTAQHNGWWFHAYVGTWRSISLMQTKLSYDRNNNYKWSQYKPLKVYSWTSDNLEDTCLFPIYIGLPNKFGVLESENHVTPNRIFSIGTILLFKFIVIYNYWTLLRDFFSKGKKGHERRLVQDGSNHLETLFNNLCININLVLFIRALDEAFLCFEIPV